MKPLYNYLNEGFFSNVGADITDTIADIINSESDVPCNIVKLMNARDMISAKITNEIKDLNKISFKITLCNALTDMIWVEFRVYKNGGSWRYEERNEKCKGNKVVHTEQSPVSNSPIYNMATTMLWKLQDGYVLKSVELL